MEFSAIQRFLEDVNEKGNLRLELIVKSTCLETVYVLKNEENILKEHYDLEILFAFLQGINFALKEGK